MFEHVSVTSFLSLEGTVTESRRQPSNDQPIPSPPIQPNGPNHSRQPQATPAKPSPYSSHLKHNRFLHNDWTIPHLLNQRVTTKHISQPNKVNWDSMRNGEMVFYLIAAFLGVAQSLLCLILAPPIEDQGTSRRGGMGCSTVRLIQTCSPLLSFPVFLLVFCLRVWFALALSFVSLLGNSPLGPSGPECGLH